MAATSWMGSSYVNLPAPAATYYGAVNNGQNLTTFEGDCQTISAPGVYSRMSAYVRSSSGGTLNAAFRVNGVDGAQAISVGAGLTGWFTDASHSDTVLEGDLVGVRVTTTDTISLGGLLTMGFTAPTATTYLGPGVESPGQFVSRYQALGGSTNNGSDTEAQEAITLRATGTLSKLSAAIGGVSGPAVQLRRNSANANQSTPGGGSGVVTDMTNTDAVASGDFFDLFLSSGIIGRYTHAYVRFVSDNDRFDMIAGGIDTSGGNTIGTGVSYLPLQGNLTPASVEADAQSVAPAPFLLRNLRVLVASNGMTNGTMTVATRINGATGVQAVSWPSGSTGMFEDTTNVDSVAAGDAVCLQCTGAQTTGNVSAVSAITGGAGQVDVTASGIVGTLTMSAPAGAAVVQKSVIAQGELGTIGLSAPAGTASSSDYGRVTKAVAYAAPGSADAAVAAKIVAYAAPGVDDSTGPTVAKIVAYAVLGPPDPRRKAAVRVTLSPV